MNIIFSDQLSLMLPLYRKKSLLLTPLDTFFDKKKVTPFVLLLKNGASCTYLKYQTKKFCPLYQLEWWILLSGWWILFLTCPMGKSSILGHSIHRRTVINLDHQKILGGLVKTTLGLVNATILDKTTWESFSHHVHFPMQQNYFQNDTFA